VVAVFIGKMFILNYALEGDVRAELHALVVINPDLENHKRQLPLNFRKMAFDDFLSRN
jgi:hypothetical protein